VKPVPMMEFSVKVNVKVSMIISQYSDILPPDISELLLVKKSQMIFGYVPGTKIKLALMEQ
jgi:hypothetical protein